MRRISAVLIVSAALTAACSGKGAAPTAPSTAQPVSAGAPAGPSTQSTATITGSVHNAMSGTVTIAGSGGAAGAMPAPIDPGGRFTLAGAPTGDLQLQVTTGSAAGAVAIAAVQPSQIVEVVVAMTQGAATLESEVRQGAGEAELKGAIDALPPTTPPLTFTAAGKTVRTDASTVFVSGTTTKTFADLKVGMRVEVHGTLSGDTLTATRVEIEDAAGQPEPRPEPEPTPTPSPNPPAPNPPAPPAPKPEPAERELNGTISGLTGNASSFQFTIGTTLVKADSSTAITGGGDVPKTFDTLKNGNVVEVNGVQHDGFVQALRIHIEGPETEPGNGNGENETEVEGTLGAVSGTCPAISSTVATTKFTTSSSTAFDGAACSAFKAGDRVQVKGTKKTDGSIAATRLKRQ